MGTLVEIIALVKELPESHLEEALSKIKEIKEKADSDETPETECPHCGSPKIVRNGRKNRKRYFLCRNCKKSFAGTTKSPIRGSHSGRAVWRRVISDTVNGVPIDETAGNPDLHHETVFNMRHKTLYCIEQAPLASPVALEGVCETDETYVLESEKGRKFPGNHHRKPRRHGAKASKPGVSNEYVCVCTSVTGKGENVAVAVNRASPDGKEILEVFGGRVNEATVVLCDGKQSYNALDGKCTVAVTKRINKVNGFHSFIKGRLDLMHGVATIYLNRYAALFSMVYAADKSVVDDIHQLMVSQSGATITIAHTQTVNLLNL